MAEQRGHDLVHHHRASPGDRIIHYQQA